MLLRLVGVVNSMLIFSCLIGVQGRGPIFGDFVNKVKSVTLTFIGTVMYAFLSNLV